MRHATFDRERIKNRPESFQKADIACVEAMAQAAINVELFTIPLYMTSMYSIYGLHQINASGNNFYEGRWWPGAGPTVDPQDSNGKAFNLIFRVFIEEMLHLQLAANITSLLGFKPCFTSPALQTDRGGWICYDSTTIPHILDFTDVKDDSEFKGTKVQLQAMNAEQIKLFLAIEETEQNAKRNLNNPTITHPDGSEGPKYFESAPFDWFTDTMGENDLPLFGSIGHMYLCLWDYLEIEYDNGDKLLDLLMAQKIIGTQRDEFNSTEVDGKLMKEYPGIAATLDASKNVKLQLINVINAITDQGEGAGVVPEILSRWQIQMPLTKVSNQFQVSPPALEAIYPGYTDSGEPTKISGQAYARIVNKAFDHFEAFELVQKLIQNDDFMTWDLWHQNPENQWTAAMLNPNNTPPNYKIPAAEDIANALNNLKANNAEANFELFSRAAVGTILGITSQLDQYWLENGEIKQFPSPAMYGSGDRLSICWAITGRVPDLSLSMGELSKDIMHHACQGMNLNGDHDPSSMPNVNIYHSCKGSNECRTQGGCGFVQNSEGGGNCSQNVAKPQAGCGLPTMSAPADNKCQSFGGCAVPISASQLFPAAREGDSYVMQLFNFGPPTKFPSEALDTMAFKEGEPVYDVAWRAYRKVQEARGVTTPEDPPEVDDLRLAFPPST